VNRDINRDINRNVDWDADLDGDWWDNRWGCCYHPIAGAAAVAGAYWAGAATADYYDDYPYYAPYVGETIYVLPGGCTTVVVNGVSYQQCGDTWYQPQFSGSDVTYIVVSDPN
jgi:hypothetical protein